jgi:hypothetical protein
MAAPDRHMNATDGRRPAARQSPRSGTSLRRLSNRSGLVGCQRCVDCDAPGCFAARVVVRAREFA